MAFADPLVLTVGGVARNLARIDSARGASEYMYSDATQRVSAIIRSTTSKKADIDGRFKERHHVSFRWTVYATATVPEYTRQCSATLEHIQGDDPTAWDDTGVAMAGFLTVANIGKLANFES